MSTTDKQAVSPVSERQRAMADALASVRAEGLYPTGSTTERLKQYVDGQISANELYKLTLAEVKQRVKSTVS